MYRLSHDQALDKTSDRLQWLIMVAPGTLAQSGNISRLRHRSMPGTHAYTTHFYTLIHAWGNL